MSELTPITRIESYLDAIVNGGTPPLESVTRIENFLDAIYNGTVSQITPVTRIEMFLAKISGQSVTLPHPITRIELYLAAIAGETVVLPETPITRIEMYLADWVGGGLPEGYTQIAGINYDGNVYYKITDFFLTGADTLNVSFSASKACNVIGCYTGTTAQNNYSIYVSTASNAKYMRYNGGTYYSIIEAGVVYDVTMTPTGSTGLVREAEWEQVDFTADSDFCVGTTAVSASSAKLNGTIYGPVVVAGRLKLTPCKRDSDGAIGYHDGTTFWTSSGSGTPTEYIP